MGTLKKQSLVDQIYVQLRDDIIEQNIPWGERLNVSELQEKFGISSTPIREALNRLQKEGLVEYKNNIGANVIDISEKDIVEIQEVGMTLDCAAIKYAMKTENLDIMAEELLNYIRQYQETNEEAERSHIVEKFIDVFYKYSRNSRLVSMAQLIKGQQSMLRSTYRKEKKELSNMEDHVKIYNSILANDINGAIEAIEENYRKATEILKNVICNKK